MKAEKEVIGLVEELKKHNLESAKAERLKEMICSKIPDDFFGGNIGDISIVDEPKGKQVGNGVWGTLSLNFSRNLYIGVYYYPIEDSEKYIAVTYSYQYQGGTK
jgi:hypothetical protein